MSTVTSSGSPAARGRPLSQFKIHDEGKGKQDTPISNQQKAAQNNSSTPLTTSKLENLQVQAGDHASGFKSKIDNSPVTQGDMVPASVDTILARLSEQQVILKQQKHALSSGKDGGAHIPKQDSSPSSMVLTPGSDKSLSHSQQVNAKAGNEFRTQLDLIEMVRLKEELDAAKNQIALQKQELDQTRVLKHTQEPTMVSSSSADLNSQGDISADKGTVNTIDRHTEARQDRFTHNDDARSDFSDTFSTGVINNTGQSIWTAPPKPAFNVGMTAASNQHFQQPASSWGQPGARPWNHRAIGTGVPQIVLPQQQMQQMQQRTYSGPASTISSSDGGVISDYNNFPTAVGGRRSNNHNTRNASLFSQNRGNGWDLYAGGVQGLNATSMAMDPTSAFQSVGMYPSSIQYQPRPIGTPLSPTAEEFRATQPSNNPWNVAPPSSPGQTYISPMEPLNYRRLLDRSVSCNWKYIVDKIVCSNDQQASIFLQQKLKVGTVEQKYEIIEAIVAQAYPLMVNRFGNFLVQRCFEHGTPEQVIAIANSIRGNTLSLSMDAFGCHVVQKAFDAVPEEYKAIMVHELLRRIPETVIHRYACHVWQKLFELRWSDSPPQIMKFVNEALVGMWHDVALGETGSLVVQNIFENCLEEDKRPCINGVLANIDLVAHGQFGNWCIQHICEHGQPLDRSRAVDHVLRYATEYSMDQFASKVVEKCLKVGGTEFLDRYLERVCEGRADRPRIPLIDIASDQYGNYLIQYILTHANASHREIVASHIRKHMVSLRGSKFGSRVGMLCCNPAYATHPGPGVGLPTNRFPSSHNNSVPRFGGAYR